MKRTFSFPLAAAGLLLAVGLTNCKKEQNAAPQNDFATGLSTSRTYATLSASNEDRIDSIVRNLEANSYSLSFDAPIPSAGITRTAYGADSYLVYATAPGSSRLTYQGIPYKFPVYRIPKLSNGSCPAYGSMVVIAKQINELLQKADPLKYGGLQNVELTNGGAVLMGRQQAADLFNVKTDRVEELLKGVDAKKYMLLNDPSAPSGLFIRNFYGSADLNETVLTPYSKSIKDIIKPRGIGCFNNEIMKVIKEKFEVANPSLSRGLTITPLAENRNISVLSF